MKNNLIKIMNIPSLGTAANNNETGVIYYSVDGSDPTSSSQVYSEAIQINQTTVLKFFSIDGE